MDPQTILIGIVIFVVSALLIYFIAAVTMREKTFEEVMAEQRKRQEEEREKVQKDKKMEKELLKKKYKKGKGDKSKEKSAQVSEPELKDSPKSQHKMVNLEIEPEIIEPTDSMVLSSSAPKKSSSGTRKRSILHNKDEVTPVAEKAVELPHKPIKPLDDLELKKLHDAHVTDGKKDKGGRQHTEARQEVKEVVKEVKVQKVKATRVESAEAVDAAPMEEKKASKAKSNTAVEGTPVSGSRLIDMVRSANLSDREVQTLVEFLLNRQGASAATHESWNKKSQKGDPVAVMKKQLEEKERALQEGQQLAMSANARAKELRSELATERTKMASVEKHYQERGEKHAAELEALQARMRHAHEQHMAEIAKLQAHIQQVEKNGDAALVQKLKQENRILQESLSKASTESVPMAEVNNLRQKVSIMEKELSNSAVRLNASENAKKSSDDKLKKYEEQIKKLEASMKGANSESKKVEEMSVELRKSESKNSALALDLKKATSAVSSAEAECTTLKTKLQELEKHLSASDTNKEMGAKLQESERKKQELEGNVKNLEKQLAESVHRQDDMGTELQKLRQENSTLSQELKVTKERVSQAAPPSASNGDIHKDEAKDVIHISQHETIVSEKVAELARLQSELEVHRSSATQITELKMQLDAQKEKNNELRAKNWKAMDALEKAEKSAAEKVDKSLKSSRESIAKEVSEVEKSDKELLKRLFPSVKVNDKLGHKEWLVSFEKHAAQHLAQVASSEKSVSEKMSHLEEERSRLQADVEVFKNNIAILHSEKGRIKELEDENRKLQIQSESYEKNFAQHNSEREKVQHLEEENQRLKNSSSKSLALSEEVSRLNEEQADLQARLVEKENNIAEAEKKLHNLEQVVETEEKKWKEKLRQAEEAVKETESSSREQELEDLTIQQQTQIEHYRTVLSDTESILRRLETAEKTWEEKLQTSQSDLQKARSDYQKVQSELQSMRGSTEMQGKIQDLEIELRQSTERVEVLVKEREELTSKMIVLESQSKACVQVDNEDIRKQLEEVQRQVEIERKKNKDLSSTLVRLNGIIKTGQDALTQEQKLVQQLQEQLNDKTKGSGASASQEIEQLRNKLSEKEKQLEREIAANKQLSQRLGTSGADLGTSV